MSVIIRVIQRFESFVLGYCKCGCGKEIPLYDFRRKKLRFFVTHHNIKGKFHPMWIGRVKFIDYGYLAIYRPDHHFKKNDNSVRLHRFVYEYFHKCCLLPWAHIHHINGIKTDNHKRNLIALTNSQHRKLHGKVDMSNRLCLLCNSTTTFYKKRLEYFVWYKYKDGFICQKCYSKLTKKKDSKLLSRGYGRAS